MEDKFKLKFWGVRGSYPVPGKRSLKYGGNTPCVEVRINDELIIIDAGTGLINLGDSLIKEFTVQNKKITATMLFSHMHYDHIQGFPFFKPAYIGTTVLYMFSPKLFENDIGDALSKEMISPIFPIEVSDLYSTKIIRTVDNSNLIMIEKGMKNPPVVYNKHKDTIEADDNIIIEVLKGYSHPRYGILFYKIFYKNKVLVYATDTEGYIGGDEKLINFAKGCDVLIHDAQYRGIDYKGINGNSKQGYGHSSIEMAVEVAKRSNAGKLILFHHDPENDDSAIDGIEKEARNEFNDSIAAYEGMEINLL